MTHRNLQKSQAITYLTGVKYGDENSKPDERINHNVPNFVNIVKSLHMAMNQKPYNVPIPCKICGKNVTNIKKHMKSHNPEQHKCPYCQIILTRADNLKRHLRMKHYSVLGPSNFSNIQSQC